VLRDDEPLVVDAELDARIQEEAQADSYGLELTRTGGGTTVAMDGEGT
jgi:hypothetical protein